MKRSLWLKKETLVELTGGELGRVVAAGAYPTQDCTLPVNQCLLSVGAECQYTDYPNCDAKHLIDAIVPG